jgi:hypothetical protein
MHAELNVAGHEVLRNIKKSRKYRRIKWAVMKYPPCAVVGGGPGLVSRLDELRAFKGDIFAVNDTAGFLSDNGIECFLYAIDASRHLFKIGPLVNGAIFGSRVNRKQFNQFEYDNVAVFDQGEDISGGIVGGPTAVCRAPHLFLRMGYMQVWFYGCEACFYDYTHVSGNQDVAFNDMMIIEAGGVQYLTNASMYLQTVWLAENIAKHHKFLINRSDGILKAFIENPDTWFVKAIGKDMKKQYDDQGATMFSKKFEVKEDKLWQPPAT